MDIKESILNYIACRDGFEVLVNEFVQDKSRPLDERWDIFVKAEVGKNSGSYEDFTTIRKALGREVSWYDDFYLDRHAVMEMTDLVEQFEDMKESTPELVSELKEEILEKFMWSFENDW